MNSKSNKSDHANLFLNVAFNPRYEAKMEELKEKFETSAKMKAKYEIYQRKRLAIIQTIKNSLQENDLMLEIVTSH